STPAVTRMAGPPCCVARSLLEGRSVCNRVPRQARRRLDLPGFCRSLLVCRARVPQAVAGLGPRRPRRGYRKRYVTQMSDKTDRTAATAPHPVLKKYYESESGRRPFVSALFDNAAQHYDWVCAMGSLGSGRFYRSWVLTQSGLRGGMKFLDIARPSSAAGQRVFRLYFERVLPLLTRISTGSAQAELLMKYYWDTIAQCVPSEQIIDVLGASGFTGVARRIRGGVLNEYVAL